MRSNQFPIQTEFAFYIGYIFMDIIWCRGLRDRGKANTTVEKIQYGWTLRPRNSSWHGNAKSSHDNISIYVHNEWDFLICWTHAHLCQSLSICIYFSFVYVIGLATLHGTSNIIEKSRL